MSSIEKRNGRWRVRWYEPGGARRSKTFDRKIDAERWLTKVGHDQLTGAYVNPSAGQVTFRAYAEEWRATKAHRESTAVQVESNLRVHVYPVIGDIPIGRIRPTDIQALIQACTARGLAPATVEVVYVHVAEVFKRAVRDRLIPSTPCLEIELPRVESGKLVPLTVEQVQAVAAAIDERHQVFVWVAAGAGLRPSEVTGLQVAKVDFLRRTIRVDTQLWTPPKGPARLTSVLKTSASHRTVPVGATVIDAVAAHLAEHGPGPNGLLMSTRTGGAVRRNRLNGSWNAAKRAAGLPEWAVPHDLRHFYASLLIHQGLDVKTIQARLGHRSATTTLDVYGHLWPDDEDRTRNAVDAVLGAGGPGS